MHSLAKSHYWSRYFARLDPMHVLDHKGVICIAAGSILVKLVSTCERLGRTQQLRLDALNTRMKNFQAAHGVEHRMPSLRLQDLKSSGWADLKGKVVKAANSRALLPWLDNLAQTFFAGHGSYNSSMRKVFSTLVDIQKLFYSSEMFISAEGKKQLDALFKKLGRHWQNLRYLSSRAGEDAFQITPKVHLCLHFPEQALLINPIFTQCYGEESLIGKATKIWAASAQGT